MIEKERLEQLIEQGATVYSTSWREEVELNKETCSISKESDGYILTVYEDEEHSPHYCIDYLEEDWVRAKEKTEWEYNIHTSRTESFKPPLWEDIEIKDEPYTYSFSVPELHCRGKILVLKTYISVIWGYTGYCEGNKPFGETTKENYIKAVEFARKLFKGEEV